ncbi:MAG: hypothetical protein EOP84_11975 [Verrucomicrobiaceae bacterium]|nr:MAG: hypothetical protein EOP84_11975 [Verrucomicrobiaceae bacterium]
MKNDFNTCHTCEKEYLRELYGDWKLCPQCLGKEDAENAAKKSFEGEEHARLLLKDTIPARYATTITSHPSFNSELWGKVQIWRPTDDKPWLLLIGESGACKTRCAFLLLSEMVMKSVTATTYNFSVARFAFVTAYDLHEAVTGQYSDDRDTKAKARALLDKSKSCELLLFDDFGKARNSPAYSAALFGIVDHRHAYNLPTIYTANSTPEQLVAGMGEDMAGPLAGRIIECSHTIIC